MDSHVELGWEPLDLTDEELQISDLLKDCSWVDHSVPAVTHMRGGSQVCIAIKGHVLLVTARHHQLI